MTTKNTPSPETDPSVAEKATAVDSTPDAGDNLQKGDPENSKNAADSASGVADGTREIGGPKGPEPTRYGDWEQNGRCTDF